MKKKLLFVFALCILLVTSCSSNNVVSNKVVLENTVWEFQNDKSQINFNDNNTFKYYQSKDNLDDYYYTGDYEIYEGEAAIKYVTEDLSDYGITRKELTNIFSRNKDYSKDNFVCLVLNNKEQIIEGKNNLDKDLKTPYFGFYYNNTKEYMDIANMNTANYTVITKVK